MPAGTKSDRSGMSIQHSRTEGPAMNRSPCFSGINATNEGVDLNAAFPLFDPCWHTPARCGTRIPHSLRGKQYSSLLPKLASLSRQFGQHLTDSRPASATKSREKMQNRAFFASLGADHVSQRFVQQFGQHRRATPTCFGPTTMTSMESGT
jgi:hypothetical protein